MKTTDKYYVVNDFRNHKQSLFFNVIEARKLAYQLTKYSYGADIMCSDRNGVHIYATLNLLDTGGVEIEVDSYFNPCGVGKLNSNGSIKWVY